MKAHHIKMQKIIIIKLINQIKMKQYIPYIVILLIAYLVVGFVRMEFNPVYWVKEARIALIVVSGVSMIIYKLSKLIE
jgi:hypothetical protein